MIEQHSKILDSGKRRKFSTGAVRDIAVGKGRMDLLPLNEIAQFAKWYGEQSKNECTVSCAHDLFTQVLNNIGLFLNDGNIEWIYLTIGQFICRYYNYNLYNAILDLSIHYEEGSVKYKERNWEKGINCHCYIDSGLRHFVKLCRGDNDEPHHRAFLWNMFGLLWTLRNKPELNDLPFQVQNNLNLELLSPIYH